MDNRTERALKELNSLIDSLIRAEADGYSKGYKESKWYKEPSLSDAVGEVTAWDIRDFKDALASGECDAEHFLNSFEKKAKEYGKSWYDEDLHQMRTGCEWESGVYATLRNIAAICMGDSEIETDTFYEGIGV